MQINRHKRAEQRNETEWNGKRSTARTSVNENYKMKKCNFVWNLFKIFHAISVVFIIVIIMTLSPHTKSVIRFIGFVIAHL